METGWYDMLVDFITTLGFPITVAVYLLWRDSKKMDMLITTMTRIEETLEKLCTIIQG